MSGGKGFDKNVEFYRIDGTLRSRNNDEIVASHILIPRYPPHEKWLVWGGKIYTKTEMKKAGHNEPF